MHAAAACRSFQLHSSPQSRRPSVRGDTVYPAMRVDSRLLFGAVVALCVFAAAGSVKINRAGDITRAQAQAEDMQHQPIAGGRQEAAANKRASELAEFALSHIARYTFFLGSTSLRLAPRSLAPAERL